MFGPSDCDVQPFFVDHKAQAFLYAPLFSTPILPEFIEDFVAANAVKDYDLFLLSLKGINGVDGVVPIVVEIQICTFGFQLFDLSLVRSNDCNFAFKLLDILSAEFCQVLNEIKCTFDFHRISFASLKMHIVVFLRFLQVQENESFEFFAKLFIDVVKSSICERLFLGELVSIPLLGGKLSNATVHTVLMD